MTRLTPIGKPFQVGADPRRNTRAGGRPPDRWKRELAALVTRDATLEHVRTVLDAGAEHPQFFRALAYATDHGIGRATQPLEMHASGLRITVITGVPPSDEALSAVHSHTLEPL